MSTAAAPRSPCSLADPPPKLTAEQLKQPTSHLYASSDPIPRHYGAFASERAILDWNYHKCPTKERQQLQDEIVEGVLRRVSKECEEQEGDRGAPEVGNRDKPLALFTAG